MTATWRPARTDEHPAIAGMCLAFYREDPGVVSVSADQVRETLRVFEAEPSRGQALVLETGGAMGGYALLVPYWSNEYGGLVCEVDEIFVSPGLRSHGYGQALFDAIAAGAFGAYEAIALGVTPGNARARALYERLGFTVAGTAMMRLV